MVFQIYTPSLAAVAINLELKDEVECGVVVPQVLSVYFSSSETGASKIPTISWLQCSRLVFSRALNFPTHFLIYCSDRRIRTNPDPDDCCVLYISCSGIFSRSPRGEIKLTQVQSPKPYSCRLLYFATATLTSFRMLAAPIGINDLSLPAGKAI